MDTQTTTGQRFSLDEAKAQEWLQRAVANANWTLYRTGSEPEGTDNLPEITEGWHPLSPGNEVDIFNLVQDAFSADIIVGPDSFAIEFEYNEDSDDGWYRYLISVGPRLTLASGTWRISMLCDDEARGPAAALAILGDAVASANTALEGLDEYVASRR